MEKEEKKSNLPELIAAIVIGLATTLGAWSAYQSTLFSGESNQNYIKGTNVYGSANNSSMQSMQQYMFDMITWMEYLKQTTGNDTTMISKIKNKIMSDDIRRAVDWSEYINYKIMDRATQLVLAGDTSEEAMLAFEQEIIGYTTEADQVFYDPNDTVPVEDPNDADFFVPIHSPKYIEALTAEADDLYKQGDEFILHGQQDNETGDKYMLFTVLYTIVLFFAGISTTMKSKAIRFSFLIISLIILAGSGVWMIMMPIA